MRAFSEGLGQGDFLGGLSAGIDKALDALGPLGEAAKTIKNTFIGAFVAMREETQKLTKEMDRIRSVSRETGGTNRQSQVLLQTFRGAGVDDTEARRFSERMAEIRRNSNETIRGGLERINLNPVTLARADSVDALDAILSRLAEIRNVATQNQATEEIFGTSFRNLATIIRQGRSAVGDAVRVVQQTAPNSELLRILRETQEMEREVARRNQGPGLFSRAWSGLAARTNWFFASVNTGIDEMLIDAGLMRRQNLIPGPGVRPQFSETRAQRVERQAADDAAKLVREWREAGDLIGLSARQAEIYRMWMRGASEETLSMLRYQDEILTRLEREHEVRRRIVEQMADSRPGSGEFGMVGLDARGMDAMRIVADIETRRNNGLVGNGRQREAIMLEAINDVLRLQLDVQRDQERLMRGLTPVVPTVPLGF